MKKFLAVLVVAAMALMAVPAFAYDVKVDDDTFAKVGVKAQIRYVMSSPDAAGVKDIVDVSVPNARIYFGGQATNTVKFGFNFDMARAAGGVQGTSLSDGFIMFDLAKELKVMTGIYRMAVSRVGLQDSYQYILVTAPDVAAPGRLSTNLAGYRSGGLTLWGDLAGDMVRYNVGFWDGDYAHTTAGFTNPNDEIGMTARVVVNFMDPEKGYTCPGCYLGKGKIANVGLGYLTQDGKVAGVDKTYTVTTLDAFYEAAGVTAEAAVFQYDYDTATGNPTGMYLQAAYLMDKIQPALRYETYDADAATTAGNYTRATAGVNYLMDGQNAKISLEVAMKDFELETAAVKDTTTTQVQIQVQF